MIRFFECSFKRDDAFIENLRFSDIEIKLSGMKKDFDIDAVLNWEEEEKFGIKPAILVTGGFHSENLSMLFKEKGISYISIIPKFISDDNYKSPYLIFWQVNKQYFITKWLGFTSHGSMIAIATKLAQLSADPDNADISSLIHGGEDTKIFRFAPVFFNALIEGEHKKPAGWIIANIDSMRVGAGSSPRSLVFSISDAAKTIEIEIDTDSMTVPGKKVRREG